MERWFWPAVTELFGKPIFCLYTLPAILCGLGVLAYIIIKTIQEFRKK